MGRSDCLHCQHPPIPLLALGLAGHLPRIRPMFGGNIGITAASIRRQTLIASPSRGGARRKLLFFLVLLVIVVALLPMIVAKTPLPTCCSRRLCQATQCMSPSASHAQLVQRAVAHGRRSSTRPATRCSPPTRLGSIAHRSTSRLNSHDLGAIQIVRPRSTLKSAPTAATSKTRFKSCWPIYGERQIARTLQQAPAQPRSPSNSLTATIFAEDVATGRVWRIKGVNAQYDNHNSNGGLGRGNSGGQFSVAEPNGTAAVPAGRFAMTLKAGDGGRQELTFQADGVALAFAEPWLRRFAPGSQISGTLSGNGTAAWTPNPNAATAA